MKFDNPFLEYLANKYEFNLSIEWLNYIKTEKIINNFNEIEILILELSKISGYTFDEIKGSCRKRDLTEIKHIGRYIAWNNQLGSLSGIGKAFGQKDHSTMIYSINLVKDLLSINQKSFLNTFNKYKHLLHGENQSLWN